MRIYKDHLILSGSKVKEALVALNELSQDAILFVVDSDDKLIGALTDGDVRRGLIKGYSIDSCIDEIIQDNPRFIIKGENNLEKIIEYREGDFRILPVVDEKTPKNYLPLPYNLVYSILMALQQLRSLKLFVIWNSSFLAYW